MRESLIEKYLVAQVKALGGECRKVSWVGRGGAPDRLVMLPTITDPDGYPLTYPRTEWVELKATGEKAKPHQLREHARMRAMGQSVTVIDSLGGVDALLGAAFGGLADCRASRLCDTGGG